jgi:hypothetical protein
MKRTDRELASWSTSPSLNMMVGSDHMQTGRLGSADDPDVLGLQTFRSPLDLELDGLAFR